MRELQGDRGKKVNREGDRIKSNKGPGSKQFEQINLEELWIG